MNLTFQIMKFGFPVLLIIISGVIGFIVGSIKAFREAKQNAYKEILPPIVKMAYEPQQGEDNKEFNKALALVWIYANKKVAVKMDRVVSIINKRDRGNITEAIQEAIVEMRNDVQLWSCQRLNPIDIKHLYTKVIEEKKQE